MPESENHASPAAAMREAAANDIRTFATAILHGDDEHRAWLLEAAEAFVSGNPLPPPRGKGTAQPPTVLPLPSPEPAGAEPRGCPTPGACSCDLAQFPKTWVDFYHRCINQIEAAKARASSAEAEIERLREIEGANIINKNALALCKARLSAREAEIEQLRATVAEARLWCGKTLNAGHEMANLLIPGIEQLRADLSAREAELAEALRLLERVRTAALSNLSMEEIWALKDPITTFLAKHRSV